MENVIQELIPYLKGFAGVYLITNIIGMIICIIVAIFVIKRVIKSFKEFDDEWNNIRKR